MDVGWKLCCDGIYLIKLIEFQLSWGKLRREPATSDYSGKGGYHTREPTPAGCPSKADARTVWPQLDVRLRERDSRWHCERSWTMALADGAVEFFFIDTSPMVQEYHYVIWAVNRGVQRSSTMLMQALSGCCVQKQLAGACA